MATGVLVAVGAADFEPALLRAAEVGDIHVVRRCVDVADLLATAASGQADVALVSGQLRGLDLEVVERLRSSGVAVVGITAEAASPDEAVLRGLGVRHVGSVDDPSSLRELIVEAVQLPERQHFQAVDGTNASQDRRGPLRRGRVIAVWGPTGAPGRSTLALGLSAELAALGRPTLLVDADVYGGSVATRLAMLDEASGLLAAARAANSGYLTPGEIARRARQVSPGLRVLSGLPRADRWTEVKGVLLRSILDHARAAAEFTVVDCGFSLELDEEIMYDTTAPRRNGATIEALERADLVLVVGSADPVGLTRLIRAVSELAEVVPTAAPRLVVNRVRSGLGWSTDEIAATLVRATGVRELRMLPDDPDGCDRALLRGKTLVECAPQSPLRKALKSMAAELAPPAAAPASGRGRRFARKAR